MEVTANAVQTVAQNSDVIFTFTPVSCPCGMITNRSDSGLLTIRGGARYLCTFGADIAVPADGTAGEISVSMALDGEPIETSKMVATPASVSEYHNVCRTMYVTVPRGCCYTLSVRNTSDQAVDVEHANLIVERVR